MKPPVRDFPGLIRWLAEQHHEGVVDRIADTVGISGALADKWVKGRVKMPTFATVDKLCSAYRLDFDYVRKLIRAGLLGVIMAATAGMVPGDAGTLPVAEKSNDSDNLPRGIMTRRRKIASSLAFLALPAGASSLSELGALWHTVCEFWSDRCVGVSLILPCNPAELRAS